MLSGTDGLVIQFPCPLQGTFPYLCELEAHKLKPERNHKFNFQEKIN
jgi:hypothetical protein